jgi:hypothetical protein
VVGIATWAVIAGVGAYTGIALMRGRIDGRTALLSWLIRIGMAVGVLFDMTVKPDLVISLVAVALGAVAGVGVGVAVGATTRREARA